MATNYERIKNLSKEELAEFIFMIYQSGKRDYGMSFCDYNPETWLDKENDTDRLVQSWKPTEETDTENEIPDPVVTVRHAMDVLTKYVETALMKED